jgi:hypothetical protein
LSYQRKKQPRARSAAPSRSRPWLRRAVIRAMFSELALRYMMGFFGARSVLASRS